MFWNYIGRRGKRGSPVYLPASDEVGRFTEAFLEIAQERPLLMDIRGYPVTVLPPGYAAGVDEPAAKLSHEHLNEIVERALHGPKHRGAIHRQVDLKRVYVDGPEVLARLSYIANDAVSAEYTARKREDAEQLFGLYLVSKTKKPRTLTVYTIFCDIDRTAARRGYLNEEDEQHLRDIDSGAASPKEVVLTRMFGGRGTGTILESRAAMPWCPNREAEVSAIERRGIANSRLPQKPTSTPVEPTGLLLQHRPRFGLRTPGERIQSKMPARAPHVRDFGSIEDRIDPADAHSAFGDDPMSFSTGHRPIIGSGNDDDAGSPSTGRRPTGGATTKIPTTDRPPVRMGGVIGNLYAVSGVSVRKLPGHHREPRLKDEWPREKDYLGSELSIEEVRCVAKAAAKELGKLGCSDTNDWIEMEEERRIREQEERGKRARARQDAAGPEDTAPGA